MSCSSHINQTFIIESGTNGNWVGDTISACTAVYTNTINSCDSDTRIDLLSGETMFNKSITPEVDSTIDLGTPTRRFRELNFLSGNTAVWTTGKLTTNMIDLGLDSSGNGVILTADNTILPNDILSGGTY